MKYVKENPKYFTEIHADADVFKIEYQFSLSCLSECDRLVQNSINICLAILSASIAFLSIPAKEGINLFILGKTGLDSIINKSNITMFSAVTLSTIVILINYFFLVIYSQNHRKAILNSRKIVLLRMNLGLDYGPVQYIFPENDITGASRISSLGLNSIFSYYAIPFCIYNFFSCLLIILIWQWYGIAISLVIGFLTFVFVVFETVYYHRINIKFDTLRFALAKRLGYILGIEFSYNIEAAIANSLVNSTEIKNAFRDSDLKYFYKLLVFIEDKRFYIHHGFSWRGIAAALFNTIVRKKNRGGSTITQQLSRSIFIASSSYYKKFRRKIIELFLAKALEKAMDDKQEILECYAASVRFEAGVLGLKGAYQYFFPSYERYVLTKCHSFFLIERLAMIHSNLKVNRVLDLLISCCKEELLSLDDVQTIQEIYREQYKSKRIKDIDIPTRLLGETWKDIVKNKLSQSVIH